MAQLDADGSIVAGAVVVDVIVGLTMDPVTAAAVAAGQTAVVEWPAAWTDALRRRGLGLAAPDSPAIAGLDVLIHGGLAWSAEHQRRSAQLGVDGVARGRVVARAVIDRIQADRAQLRAVTRLTPVEALGNALEPWLPSHPLRRRLGLGIAEPAAMPQPAVAALDAGHDTPEAGGLMRRARAARGSPSRPSCATPTPVSEPLPAGVTRIWCSLCWRLVGVEIADRAVVARGTRLAVARRSPRCGVGAVACCDCADRVVETTHTWATEIRAGISATEDVTRATLDRALAGPIAEMMANGSTTEGAVPVIRAGLHPWLKSTLRPPAELLGRVVALERGGLIVGVARVSAFTASRIELRGRSYRPPEVHGQRPAWFAGALATASGRWLLDDVHHIEPFVWTGAQLAGDPLLLVVERLRAQRARLVPWVRWPDPGRPGVGWHSRCPTALLPVTTAEGRLTACAVAAAGLLGPEAAVGRWRLTGGELVGHGLRIEAPPARTAWATLLREARRREHLAPAPYPLGAAPPGRYWILRPDGPAFIDHPGGEADGVVWLARVRQPAMTAGEARTEAS